MRLTGQLVLTCFLVFGASVTAQAKGKQLVNVKLENCDCLGIEANIPTFLSDLYGDVSIETEARHWTIAKAKRAAQKKADRQCFDIYRDYASVKRGQVSSTGCTVLKSENGEEWKAI